MGRRNRAMLLNGPLEGESFMTREGVSPEGDDLPEWLDNEKGFDERDPLDIPDDPDNDEEDDDDLDDPEEED